LIEEKLSHGIHIALEMVTDHEIQAAYGQAKREGLLNPSEGLEEWLYEQVQEATENCLENYEFLDIVSDRVFGLQPNT
jgi:hypothetical protein